MDKLTKYGIISMVTLHLFIFAISIWSLAIKQYDVGFITGSYSMICFFVFIDMIIKK